MTLTLDDIDRALQSLHEAGGIPTHTAEELGERYADHDLYRSPVGVDVLVPRGRLDVQQARYIGDVSALPAGRRYFVMEAPHA